MKRPTTPATAASATTSPRARLPLGRKIAYGLGDWGNTTTSTIFTFFFLYFLTGVARLPAHLAGLVMLAGGIWDAVNDPLIGVLVDRVRTRWGRRRPFFLFNALPLAATFTMMWWVPDVGDLGKFAWYAVAFILFDTCFTLMTVPYGAMTAEMSGDYDERTELTGWRMGTSMVGGLVAAFFVPQIVRAFGVEGTGYLVAGAGFGLLAAVPYVVLFFTTRESFAAVERPRTRLLEGFLSTLKNRTFRYAAGVYLLAWTTVSLVGSLLQYFVTDWLRIPGQLEYILALVQGLAAGFIVLVVFLSGRLDKRAAYAVSAGSWALVMLGLSALPRTAIPVAYVLAGLAGFGVAGAHVVPWSMVPDAIEEDEIATGTRREGAFYGMAVCIQKVAAAFTLFLVSLVLGWAGYRAGVEQPASALVAIRVLIGVLPALMLGASIAVAWKSPMGRDEHRRTLAEAERRRMAPPGRR